MIKLGVADLRTTKATEEERLQMLSEPMNQFVQMFK